MSTFFFLAVLALLTTAGFYMGRGRSKALASGGHVRDLHSLPSYYGYYVALWCALPAIGILIVWSIAAPHLIEAMVLADLPPEKAALKPNEIQLLLNNIKNVAENPTFTSTDPVVAALAKTYRSLQSLGFWLMSGCGLVVVAVGGALAMRRVQPKFRSRNRVDRIIRTLLIVCSTLAVFTTIGIVLSLLFESLRFFEKVSIFEFLFGIHWSPQEAIRADQVGSSGAFGAIPVFAGTLLITVISMLVAAPVGLFSAIYLSEYASPRIRATVKPLMEILAGIPTVVYGFFAALVMAPLVRDAGVSVGLDVASESALAAGVVMGIMIIPFVSSLSDDVINAVPQAMRDGSYALGATKSETVRQAIIPAALPGIVGAFLLAISRAIGETMIVVMAAGLAANLTANPFEAVTTVTVQIVALLTGDQEFDSAKTLSAFALGLVLFFLTLCLNVIALRVVQKYRERYE